jgi:hypothetical protein
MFSFQCSFRTLAAAAGLFFAAAAAPASAGTLNFTLISNSGTTTGTGAAMFDTTGAPADGLFEFHAGDTFSVALDVEGTANLLFTELDAFSVYVVYAGGLPVDIEYFGELDEALGADLGPLTWASLSMGGGDFALRVRADTGEEGTILGTYVITSDDPPPTAVPEPASAALLGTGLAALALRRRRR